jgi:hypothetical protein
LGIAKVSPEPSPVVETSSDTKSSAAGNDTLHFGEKKQAMD